MKTQATQTNNDAIASTNQLPILLRLFLMLLLLTSSGLASAINISGTVYNDGNGGSISGNPIAAVAGNPLYVYLIDNSNTIVGRAAVSASAGSYVLTAAANTNYNVSLSSMYYNTGTSNPILGLPTTYAPTAEGVTSAGDGTPDYSVAINSGSDLTINFGIDARPQGYGYYYATPTFDSSHMVTFPNAAFTGSDPEDGTYTAGFYGRDVDLFQASGGALYYNGSLITFSSAATATRIHNFDVSLLRFQPLAGTAHQFAFSTVDNASVPEFVPNSITMPGTALPINITSFTAISREKDNYLNWQTATETGNKDFTVERSDDAVHFRTIASIPSQALNGNSSQPLNYSYLDHDANAAAGTTLYYRIRQTDNSGAFSYTSVVRLANKNTGSVQLSVAPNPSNGQLYLDMATGGDNQTMQVAVLNTTGNVIMSRSFDAIGGRLSTALDMSAYPAGTYYVQLRGTSTPMQVRQFVLLPH